MLKRYTFKKSHKGYIGSAYEMAVKYVTHRSNPDRLSPCGSCDFRYNNHNYDVKQNGSPVKYSPTQKGYIKGSNRVLYATHIAYNVVAEDDECITIEVDLANTQMFVVDKTEFINFLKSVNGLKPNTARGQVNIQTVWNYKKNTWHGALGKKIEAWCYEHEQDDDDLIGTILNNLD